MPYVKTTSVRPSYVCDLVLAVTPLSDVHEIRYNSIYTKLSSKYYFRENVHSGGHTLRA